MAIKIDFVGDVSQITRNMSTLWDRLDQTVDELEQLDAAGSRAAGGLEEVSSAGKDLGRIGEGAGDAARDLDRVSDASDDAARSLGDAADAGRNLDEIGDAGKDAARGLDDAGDAAGDAAKALGKIDDSAEEIGKGMRDAGDDVERMTKDVEGDVEGMDDKVRKAFRNMADHARTNTKKIGDTSKRDFDRAGDATETFKDEAKQNLSETLSSFDGSLEGMVDGLQGTLGGVVGDLGPAGIIGAGAIAAGIGVGMAYAGKVADGINETGEIATSLAEEMREVGGSIDDVDFQARMDEWGSAIQDTRKDWELWQDSAQTGFQEIEELVEGTGIAFETAFDGATGTMEEAEIALELVHAQMKEIEDNTNMGTAFDFETKGTYKNLKKLEGHLEDNIEVQKIAIESEELRADAIGVTTEQLTEQLDAQKELSDALSDSVESELDYLDTKDKVTQTIKENGRTIDKNTEKGRENRRSLIDLKDSIFDYAEAQLEAGESTAVVSDQLGTQRLAFIDAAQAAGYTEDQAEDLADAYGLIPSDIITDVGARGVQQTKSDLNGIDRNIYTNVWVQESGVGAARRRIRQQLSGVQVRVQVNPHLSYQSAW